MSTPTIGAASDSLADIQSRILAVQQRIAALSGTPISSTSTAAASDPSASTTFASSLAQAQALLTASGSGASTTSATGTTGAAGTATGDSIVTDSLKYLGTPYQWGGTDPSTGLDCSGFTQRVMADEGITIPRTAAQQATVGTAVPSLAQAQPGDLVILQGGHHVGIYVGNNQIINAPKTGDVVKIEKIWETPTAIRRVTSDDSTSTSTSDATLSSYLRQALLGSSTGTTDTSSVSSLLGLDSSDSTSSGDLSSALGLDSSGGSSTSGLLSALSLSGSSGLSALSGLSGLSGLSSASSSAASGTSTSSGVASYQSLFDAATAKYGLPSGLLASVAQVESGGNPSAVSSAGATGLMQLMPSTAAGLGVDPTNPAQAIDGAARLLSSNLKTFGTVPLALAAYNAGAGNVSKYGGIPPFAETQAYVAKVSSLMTGSTS